MLKSLHCAFVFFGLNSAFGLTAFAHDHFSTDTYERAMLELEACTTAAISSEVGGFQPADTTHAVTVCQSAVQNIELEYARLSEMSENDRSFRDYFRVSITHLIFLNLWHDNAQRPNSAACGSLDTTMSAIDRAKLIDTSFKADVRQIRNELVTNFQPKCRSAGH